MHDFESSALGISLVICSRNRAERLEACLAAVARIRCDHPWEAVLVDNGSSDGTAAVIEKFLRANPLRGCHVREPRPGLSHARNAGVAASSGKIVAFTDDDCYPAPDFLDCIREIFADERVGFAGGRILLHDPRDHPLTINESTETLRFAAGQVVPCAALQGANMAFRRAALLAVGGFDPAFGAGTQFPAEDWDAVARVCISGWDGGYFPAPTVSHHHGRKAAEASQQLAVYHYASGAVYAKLLMSPATRWSYGRHWARRIFGDAKYHHRKLLQQFHGAVDYWKSTRKSRGSGNVQQVDDGGQHRSAGQSVAGSAREADGLWRRIR
jgi:hypothetical protein